MKNLTKEQKAYFAGVFDRQCSIGVTKRHAVRNGKERCGYSLHLRATSNCNEGKRLIVLMHKNLGGKLHKYSNGKDQTRFIWETRGDVAVEVLKAVSPNLVIKKKRAEKAIKFLTEMKQIKSKAKQSQEKCYLKAKKS